MKYFAACKSAEALKREYRRLAYIHHPDRGGDTATMQEINDEYDRAFARLKNVHESTREDAAPGATYEAAQESTERPEDYREIIEKLLHMEGVEVEICGAWIWLSGNTYANREALKSAGCKWASKKRLWYWRPEEAESKSRKSVPIERIREMYGSERVGVGHSFAALPV